MSYRIRTGANSFVFIPLFSETFILAYTIYWHSVKDLGIFHNPFHLLLVGDWNAVTLISLRFASSSEFTPNINLLELSQSESLLNVDKNLNSNWHTSRG